MSGRWLSQLRIVFVLVIVLASIATISFFNFSGVKNIFGANNSYYVSKNGNNTDGQSWTTAWNELDQINWTLVQPGDVIFIDGGATVCPPPSQSNSERTEESRPGTSCGMMYESTMTLGTSGTSENPISLRISEEPGHNGSAVIFGGRSTLLPYCQQSGYVYQQTGVRARGIETGNMSHILIDGGKWSGLIIYGHNQNGIGLGNGVSNITVRNVEIYDNGRAVKSGSTWYPNLEGVALAGSNITFERAIVHDNGQDEFQSTGATIADFSVLKSWLYNSRTKPNGGVWNECRHSDGIQIYSGGEHSGVRVEESVVGPGFNQALMFGGGGYPNPPWAVVHDAVIKNTLIYGRVSPESANIQSNTNAIRSSNWLIENVTSYRPTNGVNHNLQIEGNTHTVKNSIFYGRSLYFPQGLAETPEGNCHSQTTSYFNNNNIPTELTILENSWFDDVAGADFAIQNGAPCSDKGSSITSVSDLFATFPDPPIITATPTEVLTPTVTPTESPIPSQTLTPTFTPTPTSAPTNGSMPIASVDDAFVRSEYANSNYGTLGAMNVKGTTKIIYIKFDTSALAGKTITNAKLRMRSVTYNASSSVVYTIKSASSSWSESNITYTNRPTLQSQITTFNGSAKDIWREIDITSYVSANAGNVITLGIDSTGTSEMAFATKENTAFAPSILVEYTE